MPWGHRCQSTLAGQCPNPRFWRCLHSRRVARCANTLQFLRHSAGETARSPPPNPLAQTAWQHTPLPPQFETPPLGRACVGVATPHVRGCPVYPKACRSNRPLGQNQSPLRRDEGRPRRGPLPRPSAAPMRVALRWGGAFRPPRGPPR